MEVRMTMSRWVAVRMPRRTMRFSMEINVQVFRDSTRSIGFPICHHSLSRNLVQGLSLYSRKVAGSASRGSTRQSLKIDETKVYVSFLDSLALINKLQISTTIHHCWKKEPRTTLTLLFVPARAVPSTPRPEITSSTPTWVARSARRMRCLTTQRSQRGRRGRAASTARHPTSWPSTSRAPATTCHRRLAIAWASPQFQIINSIRGPGGTTILFRILQLNVISGMRARWLWCSSFSRVFRCGEPEREKRFRRSHLS